MKIIKSLVITLFASIAFGCSTPTQVVNPAPSASPTATATPAASAAPVATPTATATPADPLQQLISEVKNGSETVALKATTQAAVSTGTYRPGTSSTTNANVTSFFVKVGDTVLAILKRGDASAAEVKAESQKELNAEAKNAAAILQRLYKDGGNTVEYDAQNWKLAYLVIKNLDSLDYIREKGFIRDASGTNLGTYEVHMIGDPVFDRNHSAKVIIRSTASKDFTVNVNTAPQKVTPGNTVTIAIDSFKYLDQPQIYISVPDEEGNTLKALDDPKTGESYSPAKKRIFTRVSLEDVRYLIEVNMMKKK